LHNDNILPLSRERKEKIKFFQTEFVWGLFVEGVFVGVKYLRSPPPPTGVGHVLLPQGSDESSCTGAMRIIEQKEILNMSNGT
jgi:hypothetical protein